MSDVKYYFVLGFGSNPNGKHSLNFFNTEFRVEVSEEIYNSYLRYLEDKEHATQKFSKIKLENFSSLYLESKEIIVDFDKIIYAYKTTKKEEKETYEKDNYVRHMSRSI